MSRLIEKKIGDIRFVGFSLAGEETVIAVPEYNVCFDVGRAPREIISIDNVCLTHGHMDHAAGIAYYLSQRGFVGLGPGRLIVQKNLAPLIKQLMTVWAEIEGNPSPGAIVGVEHLQEVELRRGLLIRAFAVNHGANALGYSLIEKRHKLKAELAGKSGPQLVELKKKGIAIEDEVEVPLITCTGDTALGRFFDLDFVKKSRVLLVECTFFDHDHRDRAKAGRHLHVDDIPKVCEAVPDAQVCLIHITRRTDMRLTKRILERALKPADRERVSIFMDRPPRRPETAPSQDTAVQVSDGIQVSDD
jgi:ribonuclease Z